jgi:hypothetical protein
MYLLWKIIEILHYACGFVQNDGDIEASQFTIFINLRRFSLTTTKRFV